MSWSLQFDEPIPLAKDKPLVTLCDAADHIMALPVKEAALPHWQLAVECLMSAAEKRGLVMLARIAMAKALSHGVVREPPAPRRKAVKTYRIISYGAALIT